MPAVTLSGSRLRIDSPKGSKSRAVAAEEQLQAVSGLDKSSGQAHQLPDHGMDPAPLGGMTHRSCSFHESGLSDRAQDVVGRSSQGQDQGVGGELTRREPLQVQVRSHLVFDIYGYVSLVKQLNADAVHSRAQGECLLGLGWKRAEFVQAKPQGSKLSIGGIEFLVRLREDELLQCGTSQVSFGEVHI